jgi:hypothetical protein
LYTELPCDVRLFHDVASSAEPVVIEPAAAAGWVYGPCGAPQPASPAGAAVPELGAAPLLAAPLLATAPLAGALLEAPLAGALLALLGALAGALLDAVVELA